jgi:hypothetical protein
MIPKWLKAVLLIGALGLLIWAVWTQLRAQQERTEVPPASAVP